MVKVAPPLLFVSRSRPVHGIRRRAPRRCPLRNQDRRHPGSIRIDRLEPLGASAADPRQGQLGDPRNRSVHPTAVSILLGRSDGSRSIDSSVDFGHVGRKGAAGKGAFPLSFEAGVARGSGGVPPAAS